MTAPARDIAVDQHYDLVINTGTVTYKQVVEMIVAYYRSKYPETDPTEPQGSGTVTGTGATPADKPGEGAPGQ